MPTPHNHVSHIPLQAAHKSPAALLHLWGRPFGLPPGFRPACPGAANRQGDRIGPTRTKSLLPSRACEQAVLEGPARTTSLPTDRCPLPHAGQKPGGRAEALAPRRGSALLTVLWLTAALSAIGLAVASNVRGETERTSTGVDETKSWFIARGAIDRAALHVLWRGYLDGNRQPLYFQTGQPTMNLDFPSAQVTVQIIPETAKLNVNSVRPEDLLRLLSALGVPIDRATVITSAIIDWRTPPDPVNPSPFDAFYLAQSPSFLPRHASFQENEELLLIEGMTPGLYYGESLDNSQAGLRDCLSVYGSNAVDVNSAQPATLQAVGLSPDDARAIVQRRTVRPFVYQDLAELHDSLGLSGARLTLDARTMYTLRATARLKKADGTLSDLRRTVAALVQFNFPGNSRNRPVGYQVLRWFDRT